MINTQNHSNKVARLLPGQLGCGPLISLGKPPDLLAMPTTAVISGVGTNVLNIR